MPVAFFIRSICAFLQSSLRNSASRGISGVHSAPVKALPGQLRTQTVQLPQRLSEAGRSGGSGASVTRLDSRTALPYSSVTSRQLFPIQPSPARAATVLCGSGVRQSASFRTVLVVWAAAA